MKTDGKKPTLKKTTTKQKKDKQKQQKKPTKNPKPHTRRELIQDGAKHNALMTMLAFQLASHDYHFYIFNNCWYSPNLASLQLLPISSTILTYKFKRIREKYASFQLAFLYPLS